MIYFSELLPRCPCSDSCCPYLVIVRLVLEAALTLIFLSFTSVELRGARARGSLPRHQSSAITSPL